MKQLKSLLIAAILFVGTSQVVSAQAKVAHINVTELMGAMPEMKAANTQLENYGKTFDNEYRIMVEEYQNKIKKYDQEAATVSDAINETRSQEVQEMGNRIQQYQQTASKDMQKKQEEILKPILEKAKAAIQKVAKAKGYQYVLDSTVGSGVIVADGPDLLADVKKELGF
ncbi:OmpH family outer membrane protein [Flavobacterium salilacus subsp. salilacus]|uniref:OmpH family outer membrane protein n=1 Tax=Flavobacterium TaxID=237 RepID=UPI00107528BE|nr:MULTISPECIES: OmpH family outer membrane protein [Flavobacterium]KAF2518220.1 OmpH family outer membrane protein [Flavobacterium salilacus subsp. salilacus]MBE1615474.1 OmpH family outer membrane protein [Flavobacterium sp. SaA2.13]NDI99265.1 OmpH family outer membrane protein [Flavobacterium salilacus subsp. altitudinum]